jgi:hypothetical protein
MSKANKNFKIVICTICVTFLFFTNVQCTVPPKEPDNAALFYYQALMLWPKPDPNDEPVLRFGDVLLPIHSPASKVSVLVLDKVVSGADPNENVKEYLALPNSRTAIGLFQEAAQIPSCDWGPLYPGRSAEHQLGVSLRRFSTFVQVYAHNLAAEGDLRSALEICIGIQRLAGHIGGDTFLTFAVSRAVNGKALRSIRHILGSMPADAETLTWLKGRLVPSHVSPSRIVEMSKSDFDLRLQYVRDNQETSLSRLQLENFPEEIEDENTREEILKRASELHNKTSESALKILESDLPFARKHNDLGRLPNDATIWVGHRLMVMDTANFNALTVALEIYLIKARTGHIPEMLPDNLAKDPYSDTDFEYKVTDEGFALRYRNDGPHPELKSRWLEYTVRRE